MSFTSITARSGRSYKLQVADPDTSPSSYVDIGGQQSLSITRNSGAIDITSVTSPEAFREKAPDGGIQDMSCSISGIFDSNTVGAQALQKANRNRVLIDCRLVSGHGDTHYFTATVDTFERSGTHEDVEKFSATVSSHGRIQYVAAP